MEEKEGSPAGGGGAIIFFIFLFFSRVGIWGGSIYVLKPPLRDADDSHNSICTIPYNTSLQDFPFSGRGDEKGKCEVFIMYVLLHHICRQEWRGGQRASFCFGKKYHIIHRKDLLTACPYPEREWGHN